MLFRSSERPVIQTALNVPVESIKELQPGQAMFINKAGKVRTAKVTPEQLAALLRQSATSTPNPATLAAVGATFDKEDDSDEV